MKKKQILLACSLATIFLTTNVFETGSGSQSVDFVPSSISSIEPSVGIIEPRKIIYKVDVSWGNMLFDYDGTNVTWNKSKMITTEKQYGKLR